jgi:release factor glutamine methyltransferase
VSLSVAQALQAARALGVDRLDAQLLLAHHLGRSRTWLLAHDDALLTPAQADPLREHLARRAEGEPLAYLVGHKEFHGLSLHVNAHVLVPRPDTEVLVNWALELLAAHNPHPKVIDLGTGSGAIALAIKQAHPAAQVLATDVSTDALNVARLNAQRLGLKVDFAQGEWWQAAPGQRFHLALSNPPYIAESDPHLSALTHEPQLALTSGPDGLHALRSIIEMAADHLLPGAWLLLEHGHDQAQAVCALLQQHGLQHTQTRRDLGGRARCSGGCVGCQVSQLPRNTQSGKVREWPPQ